MRQPRRPTKAPHDSATPSGSGKSSPMSAREAPIARTTSIAANEPAELMSDTCAAGWLSVSRASFWRRVADGTLPGPIKIGGRTLWRRSELLAVIEGLAEERDQRSDHDNAYAKSQRRGSD